MQLLRLPNLPSLGLLHLNVCFPQLLAAIRQIQLVKASQQGYFQANMMPQMTLRNQILLATLQPHEIPLKHPLELPLEIPLDLPLELLLEIPFEIPFELPLEITLKLPLQLPLELLLVLLLKSLLMLLLQLEQDQATVHLMPALVLKQLTQLQLNALAK